MAKKKESDRMRFIFGRDMSIEKMVDADVRMAKEHGIQIMDDRKERGIQNAERRKKERRKSKKQ